MKWIQLSWMVLIMLWIAGTLHVDAQKAPGALPLTTRNEGFVENRGQVRQQDMGRGRVLYECRSNGLDLYFFRDGYSYVFREFSEPRRVEAGRKTEPPTFILHRVDVQWLGCYSGCSVQGDGLQEMTRNYYQAHLQEPLLNVPSFNELEYRDIYPGIDVRFQLVHGQLKYEYHVQPHADLSRLLVHISNADAVRVDEDRTLEILKSGASIRDHAPLSWQEDRNGKNRTEVSMRLTIPYANTLQFECASGRDESKELVIDPAITWSTYWGGSRADEIFDVCVDHADNVLVCGGSYSDLFPGSTGINHGDYDIFVSKFSPNQLPVGTYYMGGPELDLAYAIAVDASNNYFVCGESKSSDLGFKPNVFQYLNSQAGAGDGIIFKLNSSLALLTGSFIGGGATDEAYDVAVDPFGNVGVVGYTGSNNFPVLNAQFPTRAGTTTDQDAFLSKWSGNLTLLWSTYYGGSYADRAQCVAFDAKGNLYFGGSSSSSNLPNLNGFQQINRGVGDALIGCFTAQGVPLMISLCGGPGADQVSGMAIYNGLVVVCGVTASARAFPSGFNSNAYTYTGNQSDGFVMELDTAIRIKWSCLYGGELNDYFNSVAINQDSSVVVCGYTNSPDLPTARPLQANHRDSVSDMLLCKFGPKGARLWATAVGGSGVESASASVAVDDIGNMYLVGGSNSSDFPVLNADFATQNGSAEDGVVMKICPTTPVVSLNGADSVICPGTVVRLSADSGLSNIKWSTGQTTKDIDINTAGYYSYSATSAYGCTAHSDTLRIQTKTKIPAGIGTKGKLNICDGDSVLLYSKEKFAGYGWFDQTNTLFASTDSVWIKKAGTYRLQVADATGCHDDSNPVVITASTRPRYIYSAAIDGTPAIDTVTKPIIVCQGHRVELTLNVPGSTLVVWSNGAFGPSVTLSSSLSISASLSDSTNCVWALDTVHVVVRPTTLLNLKGPDSLCAGEVGTFKVVAGDTLNSYVWSVDGAQISGRSDSSEIQLQWTSSATHSVRVYNANSAICSDTAVMSLNVSSSLVAAIDKPDGVLLCPGTSLRLRSKDTAVHYFWNGTLGSRELVVQDTGSYTLRVDNGRGCFGTDTVVVSNPLMYTLGSSALDFGDVKVGQSTSDSVTIHNTSNVRMTLRSILGVSQFSIDSLVPAVGSTIAPGDSAVLYLRFSPTQEGSAFDSAAILILLPCNDTQFVRLRGVGKDSPALPLIRFHVNDIQVDPQTQSNVSIPIEAWIESSQAPVRLDSLFFSVQYPPQMLRVRSITSGTMASAYDPLTQKTLIQLRVPVDSLPYQPTVITSLKADVVLSDRLVDTLHIDTCSVYPSMISSMKSAMAEIRFINVCTLGGARLLHNGSSPEFLMLPNPAHEYARCQIHTLEKGEQHLQLYEENGDLKWETAWTAGADEDREILLSLLPMSNGMYVFRLQGPTQSISYPFLIVR